MSRFLEALLMTSARTRRPKSSRRPSASVGKPRGVLHPRVQQVGPEHFGIVCFDCAKVRSKFLLADFYGRILIAPTVRQFNCLLSTLGLSTPSGSSTSSRRAMET